MNNILETITEHKKIEVRDRKALIPVAELESYRFFTRTPYSLKKALLGDGKKGIIAEFKRKSPSKGMIHEKAMPEVIAKGYEKSGASAVSVLTDNKYFGGSTLDLAMARNVLKIPILRKEFMVDEYQVVEAKAVGADAILLIAACLDEKEAFNLAKLAKSLDMDVLFEIHSKEELLKLNDYVDVVGVNNRNLKTLEIDIQTSMELFDAIPDSFVKISESGISHPEKIVELRNKGYQGFLIGENFMKEADPVLACKEFVSLL